MDVRGAGKIAWLVECLYNMHAAMGSVPSVPCRLGDGGWLVIYSCKLSTQWLKGSKFKVILSYVVGSRPGWAVRDSNSNKRIVFCMQGLHSPHCNCSPQDVPGFSCPMNNNNEVSSSNVPATKLREAEADI